MPIFIIFLKKTSIFFVLFPLLFLSLFSCRRQGEGRLRRYDLFEISPGTLAGELDWFYRDSFQIAGEAKLYTQDGFIFITGGKSGKVSVFNSYGDLLTLIYNPDQNPELAPPQEGQSGLKAVPWPLRDTGSVAASPAYLFVEDRTPPDREVMDEELGVLCNRVILRFDREGNYKDYLGRKGVGGLPFPNIVSMDVREDGSIVVTGRTAEAWYSWWFDAEGHPSATVKIENDKLPPDPEGWEAGVYTIKPDPRKWLLYVRIDFYPPADERRLLKARLYTFDMASGHYDQGLTIPVEEGSNGASLPPEYLGTSTEGSHFLLTLEDPGTYRLIVMEGDGRIIHRRRLMVDPMAVIYRLFYLQSNGLLSGIFLGNEKAQVSWWRSDRLVRNG